MNVNWYGNFDLKYAGASINCNTDYKVRALEKFITRRRSHYYVNPDDVEPDKIMMFICTTLRIFMKRVMYTNIYNALCLAICIRSV